MTIDRDESISNIDWIKRAISEARSVWRLEFLSECIQAAKFEGEDWTQDLGEVRALYLAKLEELSSNP